MTDSSEAELPPPQTNGISDCLLDEEERAKIRPVEIDADVKEMERRKRVELIMNSKMFREELERIIETQLKDGSGTSGLMQQISDMMGVNKQQAGNVFKNPNCVVPINDIRGIEAMGYGKGEKILRCKLAAVFRLIDLYAWTQGTNTLVTARLNQDEEHFLVNPYGMMFHEITASSLIKVAMQGNVIEQGTTNFSLNISAFSLHAAVHAARPDIKCIINVHTPSVVAISALKHGILPLSQESVVIGDVSTHVYQGGLLDAEEKDKLARNLGPNNKVLLLTNQGALCCGETIEEAFFNARNTVLACESQLKLIPVGLDNVVLLNDEIRKKMYDAAHKAPESSPRPDQPSILEGKVERKWRVGGVEFEAFMRMLDNAGFRTGYIYRHPLVKGDPPKPKNDVEVPPAVSSLGYLLEEEELYRQGLWRKLEGGRKGHDRSRWLNSPNVYQKVEILETGTPDPKKITKWVAEGSPTHSSTPVKIDAALQFVPKGTNPKEFKLKQQQIKDYRRADKISAGPQSQILEGVTWEEARKMQDATVTQTGDQVVLMGAASKGIIQRGHQHNATVYKSPYAKNPFDSVTDEELDEYKKVVEKKVKGEYDTDYSESEGLSSAQINKHIRSPTSITSETEEESRDEPQVLRIETKQAPRPSQPEVVLSDVETSATEQFLRAERVSQNSYKSVRAVKAHWHLKYYRTNSYAGLPKGSYLIPNPVHYHIVRHYEMAKPMRPILVRIGQQNGHSSHYIFNRFNVNCNRERQTVTINIGNVRTVSLGMSMQTVTDFIYPFANALNMLDEGKNHHQGSQTSYVNGVKQPHLDYTPLIASREEIVDDDDEISENSDFEKEIMQKLQENLISDLSKPDLDSSNSEKMDDIVEFGDDLIKSNETMAADNSDDVEKNRFCKNLMEFFQSDNHKQVDSAIPNGVCLLNTLEDADNASTISQDVSSLSVDEGIGDLTNKSTPRVVKKVRFIDDNIVKIGQMLFDYLSEQGFEDSDLVIFPEILNDTSSRKLIEKLKAVYWELYGNRLSNEEKNELRLSISSYVLNLLENDDRLYSSVDSLNSFIVSDKIFSISETLSALMDELFESVDVCSEIEDDVKVFHHSTPDLKSVFEEEMFDEVTTFKKGEHNKCETYWFTIGSPIDKKPIDKTPRRIINVDDIPLPPPKDYDLVETHWPTRTLSPILEERKLDCEGLKDCLTEKENGFDDVLAGGDGEKIDGILTGKDDGYIAFESPEVNVVVCNDVSFFRTLTTNTASYVKSDTVLFNCDDSFYSVASQVSQNGDCGNLPALENDDEGDWMGYEAAKF